MTDPDKTPDSVSKLWDLGNYVAGFAAAQGIAFGFMTLQKEWTNKITDKNPRTIFIVTVWIFIGVFFEIWAILWCHRESLNEKLWHPSEHIKCIFKRVMWGRMVCVLLFGIACLMAAWGPVVDQMTPKDTGSNGFKQSIGGHGRVIDGPTNARTSSQDMINRSP